MDVGEPVDLQHHECALQTAPARALQLVDELLAKGLDPQHGGQRVAPAAQQCRLEVGDALPGGFQLALEPVAFATSGHHDTHRRDERAA